MSHDEQDDSNSSNSENETKEKSQDLVKFSKKIYFFMIKNVVQSYTLEYYIKI